MTRPRLPPHHRRDDVPNRDANGISENSDDDSDDQGPDFPHDFDEHAPLRFGAIQTLLEADDDYEPAPEPGDFWIERDAA